MTTVLRNSNGTPISVFGLPVFVDDRMPPGAVRLQGYAQCAALPTLEVQRFQDRLRTLTRPQGGVQCRTLSDPDCDCMLCHLDRILHRGHPA